MTKIIETLADAPEQRAVYVLYGGRGRSRYAAYVGIARKLKTRLNQHFVRRDSSVTTGASAASLNPEHITELAWWRPRGFRGQVALEAAELVAFEVLDPTLRSRGKIRREAHKRARDPEFASRMREILEGPPDGKMVFPSVARLAVEMRELRAQVVRLESALKRST